MNVLRPRAVRLAVTMVGVTALGLPAISTATAATAATTVEIDPATQYQTIQGWGTSLAWWAEGSGGWSSASAKNALADALFSPTSGLGLNVVRYNIGAGTPDDTCAARMRVGGEVPSFEQSPGTYDWTQDPNQRWMLQAAKARGANVFEATSYSAPAWMTLNDCSAGATTPGADNLGSTNYAGYAQYLATVVRHFHDDWGITFNTVEPFNEPVQTTWSTAADQQGMNLGSAARDAITQDLQGDLGSAGMTGHTGISASDEFSVNGSVADYQDYTAASQADLVQLNTHDYATQSGTPLYNLAQQAGKPVWMSEWGSAGGSTQIASAIQLSQHILTNEQQLHPESWVAWQGVDGPEDGGKLTDLWGLAWADIAPGGTGALTFPSRYYALGNYSEFVHPGYRMIGNSDGNTFTAYDPASRTAVIVATNPGTSAEPVDYDLSGFTALGTSATPHQTDATENLAQLPAVAITGGQLSASLPPQSITTYVIPNTTYTSMLGSGSAAPYGAQLQEFGSGSSGVPASAVYTPSSGWHSWESLEGRGITDVTGIQYGQRMAVFGKDASGSVQENVYTPGGGWSGWQDLGGAMAGAPTAVQYGGQLQVYGRASDGTSESNVYTPNSGWSGWQSQGGDLAGDVTLVMDGQRMQLYGLAPDGGARTNSYVPGVGWTGWQDLGGILTGNLAAIQNGGQVDLFGRDSGGTVYTDVLTPGAAGRAGRASVVRSPATSRSPSTAPRCRCTAGRRTGRRIPMWTHRVPAGPGGPASVAPSRPIRPRSSSAPIWTCSARRPTVPPTWTPTRSAPARGRAGRISGRPDRRPGHAGLISACCQPRVISAFSRVSQAGSRHHSGWCGAAFEVMTVPAKPARRARRTVSSASSRPMSSSSNRLCSGV